MARRTILERINGVMYFKGVRLRPRHVSSGRTRPYNPDTFVPVPPIPPLPPPPLVWQAATQPWTYYTGTFNDYD